MGVINRPSQQYLLYDHVQNFLMVKWQSTLEVLIVCTNVRAYERLMALDALHTEAIFNKKNFAICAYTRFSKNWSQIKSS